MAITTTLIGDLPTQWSIADLHDYLGGVPLQRIRGNPPPGFARVADVIRIHDREGRLYELVDGVLLEKTMGYYESRLAALIVHFLERYLEQHDLGIVLGADGSLQVLPNQVRIPDVSFIRWERFPKRQLPASPVPAVAPDLAVEVLSAGNTAQEMKRKLSDYFEAGTRLVWLIEPTTRTATAYTTADRSQDIAEDGFLTGDEVLPDFKLQLRELFARAGQRQS